MIRPKIWWPAIMWVVAIVSIVALINIMVGRWWPEKQTGHAPTVYIVRVHPITDPRINKTNPVDLP